MVATIDTSTAARWHWPDLAASLRSARRRSPIGTTLNAASYIEWRYYAVLSPAFHGVVGLALVNPEYRLRAVAESGLLLIVAGVLDRPNLPARAVATPPAAAATAAFCWMHLFPVTACRFDANGPGSLTAGDSECCVALAHRGLASADIEIEAGAGLKLRLEHVGLADAAIPPQTGRDFPGAFGSGSFGAHWTVDCPSPVASTNGRLSLGAGLLTSLAQASGSTPGYATAALCERVAAGGGHWHWQSAAGYYEHSYGVRPLPLHGWEFVFVPDAVAGQSVVLQTYRGSQALRYLDVCWQQDGALRRQRFGTDALRLSWTESAHDPVLGVRRPLARRILAEANGLRLELYNRVLHRLPLLRSRTLAVRHFFISEEIGVADWTLTDATGRVLAATAGQPCGGELAHFRLRAPRYRVAPTTGG